MPYNSYNYNGYLGYGQNNGYLGYGQNNGYSGYGHNNGRYLAHYGGGLMGNNFGYSGYGRQNGPYQRLQNRYMIQNYY